VRKFRGNVNNKKDKYNADYWALQDRNEVEDRAILRHAPDRARIMDELLQDPILNKLHFAALDRVEARLDDYRRTRAYLDLRDGLIEASKVPITEVEAKPPKARDPEKIAALMSEVEQKSQGRPKEERRTDTVPGWAAEGGDPYMPTPVDLSQDIPRDWIANHEIALPADPRVFRPEALSAIVAGRFERRHARNIAAYLDGCARVLEIGAGIGFLPIRVVQVSQGVAVMAQDSRAELVALGQEVARRAGLDGSDRLTWSDAPLTPASDSAAGGLAACLRGFRPIALRLTRADDVPPEVLAAQDPGPLRRVLLPFVSDEQAAALRARYAPVLTTLGFTEDAARAGGGSLQFDRPGP